MASKKAIINETKALIKSMTDEQVIQVASGHAGIAVFPEGRKGSLVQYSPYFAQDFPDGAAEEYWRRFGVRANLQVFLHDQGLYELPIDWLDQLSDLVASDESLRAHWGTISALISLGLKARAANLREEAIYSDIDEPLRNALDEMCHTTVASAPTFSKNRFPDVLWSAVHHQQSKGKSNEISHRSLHRHRLRHADRLWRRAIFR